MFLLFQFAPDTWFTLFRLMKFEKSGSNYGSNSGNKKKNNVEIQKDKKENKRMA